MVSESYAFHDLLRGVEWFANLGSTSQTPRSSISPRLLLEVPSRSTKTTKAFREQLLLVPNSPYVPFSSHFFVDSRAWANSLGIRRHHSLLPTKLSVQTELLYLEQDSSSQTVVHDPLTSSILQTLRQTPPLRTKRECTFVTCSMRRLLMRRIRVLRREMIGLVEVVEVVRVGTRTEEEEEEMVEV